MTGEKERPPVCPICGSRFPHVRCFLGWAGEAGPCDNDWHYPNGRADFGRNEAPHADV